MASNMQSRYTLAGLSEKIAAFNLPLIIAADAATVSPTRHRRLEETPKAHRPN